MNKEQATENILTLEVNIFNEPVVEKECVKAIFNSIQSIYPNSIITISPQTAQWQAEQKQVSAGVWVKASEKLPDEFKMYICHVKIINEGLTYCPVTYVQFDTIKKEWTNPSICNNSCEVVDWLDESSQQKQVPTNEEIERLAEKEYPMQTEEEFYQVERDLDFMYYDYSCMVSNDRSLFIKGFKSALQYRTT